MVRRVTRERAHVFLCTSVEASAQVRLYAGRANHASPGTQVAASVVTPLDRIGARLWVGLVAVDLPDDVADGAVLSYDLVVRSGGTDRGLFRLGLLGGSRAAVGAEHDVRRAAVPLGYADGMLPSFVLPPASPAELRLVHGSCRKPHGGGATEPDAIQLMDAALQRAITGGPEAARERPQQWFLTGDQVYVDDVAAGLLAALTAAGRELLGWEEDVPVVIPATEILLDPGWRSRFLSLDGVDLKRDTDDVPNDYSGNHLVRFGEWCAMYLYAWSDALWAVEGDGSQATDGYRLPEPPSRFPIERLQSLLDIADQLGFIALPARWAKVIDIAVKLDEYGGKVAAHWRDTAPKALGWASTAVLARRALANVATYTMFDDHEITDDWFLDRRVTNRLKGLTETGGPRTDARSEVGPRLLRNGLSAYAVFQHWGNVPEDFAPGRQGRRLLDMWRYTSPTRPGELATVTGTRAADALLGIRGGDPVIPASGRREDFPRIRWDYAVGFPAHRLLALDTRTWRAFPTGAPMTWASLAPLVADPPGQPPDAGIAQLRALGAAWLAVGQRTSQVVPEAFGRFLQDVVTLAGSVGASREQAVDQVMTAVGRLADLVDQVPGRLALAAGDRWDPVGTATLVLARSGHAELRRRLLVERLYPSAAAVITTGARLIRTVGDVDLGIGGEALNEVVRALADVVETAAVASTTGVVLAARRAVADAGAELWPVLVSAAGQPLPADVDLAGVAHAALVELDRLSAAVGVDRLAAALFRDGGSRLAAGLISTPALVFQVTRPIAEVAPDVPVTLLLSPAPVFGNRLVEVAQRARVAQLIAQGRPGEEEMDFETWSANVPAMTALCEAARALRCAVILSGDVHYAGSSVTDVGVRGVTTRYVQLTSSSTRNSDGQTRFLGRMDDLLYDDDGQIFLLQSDWAALLPRGRSSLAQLRTIARAELDDRVQAILDTVDLERHYEDFRQWLATPMNLSVEDVTRTAARVAAGAAVTAERMVTAPLHSVRAWAGEAAWQLYSAVEMLRRLDEDPMLAIFGDFLTAGPAAREQLLLLYHDLGLDPHDALALETVLLHDRRTDRLTPYPAMSAREVTPSQRERTNAWQRRTVGHANAGFIRFRTRGGQVLGVEHELRWYPVDDPPRDGPSPRLDWIGSLHVAGWHPHPADLARRP
ncbi:hypothetical protein ICW40_16775 [Actinotalea ferrariae]|nr:hypothetical protein [Actinotalea ferrariae]